MQVSTNQDSKSDGDLEFLLVMRSCQVNIPRLRGYSSDGRSLTPVLADRQEFCDTV